jgi:hypothetical protein
MQKIAWAVVLAVAAVLLLNWFLPCFPANSEYDKSYIC